ncbi:PREDICTED: uncharacterized protein LOC104814319 [Tarenaya hassleriana]|uniref:uncharacterized protein LOC104814319 n=1 Tax=Tarenaya hassleriana TaxID=28532 RepID=UPI00053C7AB9|nr:PREDICTED: uncharacterized protein LOC104814319 [Tarenaya hassleriana]XP_010540611.1 PREDICTED: uncharacterized protein LOC104814319 [Tarenaya hassleriana]
MGCAASSIDKEEKVLVCKERKRLMKQLLGFREEFADAQLAYLRALRNTGVTLRQFTESESLELESTSHGLGLGLGLPFSPPPTLPPSPPPPPPFSPDLRKPTKICQKNEEEECMETDENEDDSVAILPPPIPSSSWNFWDPFESLGPPSDNSVVDHIGPKCREMVELDDEEDWAETKTEFEEDDDYDDERQEASPDLRVQQTEAIGMEENSSMTSLYGLDSDKMTVVTDRRIRMTLEGIIRELDDYFLKASGCEKEIAVIIDISSTDIAGSPRFKETKRKRSNSAKVFSALSWSWSSKPLHVSMDAMESSPVEPCRPGAHCNTLEKLCLTEKKLYENVRNKEIAKAEHERKSALLKKQDEENYDHSKMEKTRFSLESLEEDIKRLEDSISLTSLCLQKLIDEELHPQLIALTSGLGHMWKTMHKCHQVQTHISQLLNHLSDYPSIDLSSEYKRQAATQLENEVTCWYNSFCKLVNSQREYVKTLCKWIQHTESPSSSSAAARKLCIEWQILIENLPDKVASEAVKSFMVSIQSIIHQQAEEYNLKKKCGKLEKRLEKEMNLLVEMERKLEGNSAMEEADASDSRNSSSKHPLSVKRVKIEALKKRMETEKGKYMSSVEVSNRMTMENLKSCLPSVFQALTAFSSAISRGFEGESQPEGSSLLPEA